MITLRTQQAKPVLVSTLAVQTTFIFTDGAFEQERGTFGGVLVSSEGRCLSYFAGELSRSAMRFLLESSAHPIYELELLPVLIAMHVWGAACSAQQVVYFLDNEPARIGMIKGSGGTAIADRLISKAAAVECQLGQHAWYARVPSYSNIADDPSAAEFSEAVLENVYAKLTGADLLRGLTAAPSTVRIPCCTTTCTLCGLDLEIGETRSTYALTWATGMQRVDYERRRCRGCLSHYSSCWVLSAWHDAKFCICSFEQPRHSQEEVRAKFCPAHPPGS
eukprot:s6497_g5.t1